MVNFYVTSQIRRFGFCVILFALLPLKLSHASGVIKVESSGFLRRSDDRADSSSTVSVGPRIDNGGKYVEGKLDLDAIIQVSDTKKLTVDRSAFTIEAANAYLGTSKKLIDHHQFSVGRRAYDWSRFDQEWEMGTISPRFIWDPTRPQTIGLTGVFHSYESKHWRVLSYASPLSIPERGYPVRSENGSLSSSNPFYIQNVNSAVVGKRNLGVIYSIDYPPMKDLLLNAGASTSVRWSSDEKGQGFWAQSMYGFLPVNQPNIAVEAYLPAQGNDIQVQVHPEIQRHHMLSLETGLNRQNFSLWASATQEIPTARDTPSTWITTRSEPAILYSAGGSVNAGRWRLSGSYLFVDEARKAATENKDFTVDLPSRFAYHRAVRTGLELQSNDRLKYELNFIDDIEFESQLISFDITYNILRNQNALTLNLGSDFFASATSKGYIGQYKGNDRFRGGVSYAF